MSLWRTFVLNKVKHLKTGQFAVDIADGTIHYEVAATVTLMSDKLMISTVESFFNPITVIKFYISFCLNILEFVSKTIKET